MGMHPAGLGVGGLRVLSLLLPLVCLTAGCPSRPPEGAAPPAQTGPVAGQTSPPSSLPPPPDAPVLKAGTYELKEEPLDRPWFRGNAGHLARSGEGVWEGSLRIDRGIRARLGVTGTGEGARAELTVDTNRDRRLDETPVVSQSSAPGPDFEGRPTRRFVFRSVDTGEGSVVALGAETSEANPRAVRLFMLQDVSLAATVPTDGEPQTIRVLTEQDRAKLWLDADNSGAPAPWELADVDGLVGLGNRLYQVRIDTLMPRKLTLEDYGGEQATVVFDATDGFAEKRGLYAPQVGGATRAQYVGFVAKAQVPAGDGGIQYLLPNDDRGACRAYVPRALRLQAGEQQTIPAGGPVKIDLQVSSQREMIDVSLSLSTAAGDSVTDWVGEIQQDGTIQLIGPDGAVLNTGRAGFG